MLPVALTISLYQGSGQIRTHAEYKHIKTSVVERHNGTSRLCNRRQVRKTLTFSKVMQHHR